MRIAPPPSAAPAAVSPAGNSWSEAPAGLQRYRRVRRARLERVPRDPRSRARSGLRRRFSRIPSGFPRASLGMAVPPFAGGAINPKESRP